MAQCQKRVLIAIFFAASMVFLGLSVRVSIREPFAGDLYEDELGYFVPEFTRPAPRSPVMDWEIEQAQAQEEACAAEEPEECILEETVAEDTSSQEAQEQEPELPLPEEEAGPYADSSVPAMKAGSGVIMGDPIARGTKALIPLYPTTAQVCTGTRFLSLAEAVEEKHARIVDSGSSSSVFVVNDSDHPIFLMCGEVIFGGKQDRVITQDTVIPVDRDKKFRVKVFCVERNRWTSQTGSYAFTCKPKIYKKEQYSPDEDPDPGSRLPSLAQVIEQRKWAEFFNNLAGRRVAHACIESECGGGGQDTVWSRVRETNEKLGTENATNSYRNNLLSPEVHERIRADIEAFFEATKDDDRAIGYAFSVDGTVLYSDIFANAELCRKYRYRLIKAYLLETLGEGCNARFTPDAARFYDFLKWVESTRVSENARPGFAFFKSEYLVGCDSTYEGKRLHSGYYYDGFSEETEEK
jgi:hypothetical protein